MDAKGSLFLKLLINKFHDRKQEELYKLLPASLQKQVADIHVTSSDPTLLLPLVSYKTAEAHYSNVHYSWLQEALDTLTPALHDCVVACLPKNMHAKLSKTKKESMDVTFAPVTKNFLLSYFLKSYRDAPQLPRELMPKTPLDMLLDLEKNDLIELIDLLAMQDLSEEVRHIVDKKLIQAILLNLTPLQQKYLKICLHQKSKIPIPPLNVKETHQDKKAFLILLHKRGLKRLAIATSGLHADFMWHLSHRLDRGRGKILLAEQQKEEVPLSTQVIQMQIQQILPILKGVES